MSKFAIVCYDLIQVKSDDNNKVKNALIKHNNVFTLLSGFNKLSSVPSWITLELPDTTILVSVSDDTNTEKITIEVDRVIKNVGANTGKIYVAFINLSDAFLYNAISS